ncbi:uncharacterized protein LOC128872209 [Hylaeus volcanicus]|uniref:uncharacterized protein LOC128872209 n=1 Tax=Hylaeus volcanicus TaxID=313075 RepID=UPI0023B7D5C4|nr:uncharacterized protein LOC128872209 [Hylaeus volcanicus]
MLRNTIKNPYSLINTPGKSTISKMKFALSLLAVLALVGSLKAYKIPSTGSALLAKEFQDFLGLVPQDRVMAILRAYAAQDKQFQTVMKLVDSQETKLYIQEVEAYAPMRDLLAYTQRDGLDIYLMVNRLNAALKLKPFVPLASLKITGGLRGLYKDIEAVLPVQKMKDLFDYKMKKPTELFFFMHELMSSRYFKLANFIHTNQHLLNIAQQAKQAGIDSTLIEKDYLYFIIARVLLNH